MQKKVALHHFSLDLGSAIIVFFFVTRSIFVKKLRFFVVVRIIVQWSQYMSQNEYTPMLSQLSYHDHSHTYCDWFYLGV